MSRIPVLTAAQLAAVPGAHEFDAVYPGPTKGVTATGFADAIVAADEARMDRGDVVWHASQWAIRTDAADRARTPREVSVKVGGRYAVAIFHRSPNVETGARGYFPAHVETLCTEPDADWTDGFPTTDDLSAPMFVMRPSRIPPMSGGSPWAARDTGWHADGCLCRSCAAVSA